MLNIRGKHYATGEVYDFILENGSIRAIAPPNRGRQFIGGEEFWVAPGLIDIQVNGYQGINFGSTSNSIENIVAVAEKINNAGVTAFCPTITTNSFSSIEASMRAIALACRTQAVARERILTIHLEGPYISPEDGPRGAHPLEFVRPPNWEEFCKWQAAADGLIGLITIAPELPGALEFIAKARKARIVVAIGHHAATREQIIAAVAAGAVLSTHLGNGAHAQLPRHPNYLWEQLANDALMASIIVDGHHLPPEVVKSFYRIKGASRIILTSDVISAAGLPPGKYQLMGLDIEVREDNSVRLSGTPYLAGSTLRLCDAVTNIMHFAGVSFGEAIDMATANPARLLQKDMEHGFLRIGALANLVLFRAGQVKYELAFTIAGGKICYQA